MKHVQQRRRHGHYIVHQSCGNPSKPTANQGKVLSKENCYLQELCKLQKSLARFISAFAWRRSGVRVPSAPLLKCAVLQAKHEV